MYVGYSWPKVLRCPGPQGRYVAVFLDHTYLVAVSDLTIAVWSSGHARVRLGQHTLTEQELELYGHHVAACWSSDRSAVAVLTENGHLLVYDLHVTKQPAIPALRSESWGTHNSLQQLHAVDVYVKHPVRCEREVPATCVCCDSRTILVAYADGFWGSCSWFGKMHPDLYDISPDGSSDDDEDDPQQLLTQQQLQQRQLEQLPRRAAVQVHYCEPLRLLGVVFADGSAALFSPAGSGQLHAQLVFRRWLCSAAARATAVSIAAQAQLIALGTDAGVVHLLHQHIPTGSAVAAAAGGLSPAAALASGQSCGTLSPMGACGQTLFSFGRAGLEQQQVVRSLDLLDWGHTARQTGAVAQLAWAPDNRALAVGFDRQGLVVWTPSGCRLLCTLRQPSPDTPASGRGSAVSPFSPNSSSAAALRPLSTGSCEAAANGTSSSAPLLQHPGVVSVDGSVLCLAWGVDGYQIVLAGQGPSSSGSSGDNHSGSSSSGVMYELSLAKSLRHHHRVTHASAADGGSSTVSAVAQLGDELHVLQAADRLLLITEALTSTGPSSFLAAGMGGSDPQDAAGSSTSDLHVHHVLLPAAYLAANWPLRYVAISPCGSDIAAAGAHGLVVYNRKQERWRMFGEVLQERRVSSVALGWLSGCVVAVSCSSTAPEPPGATTPAAAAAAAAAVASAASAGLDLTRGAGAGFSCQLLLFPRNHLDFSSVVASSTLQKVPLAMDCTDSHILLASAPLEILVLQLEGGSPTGTSAVSAAAESVPAASSRPSTAPGKPRLVAVRELSLFNVGRPVQDVALVSAAAADMAHMAMRGQPRGGAVSSTSGGKVAPRHAVLLRWGGMLSVLDLSRGAELMLADEVESFWLSDTLTVPPVAASSKAGSTCASAGHSRTSSIQGLPFAAVSGQEGLGLDAGATADEAGSSTSGTSMLDPFAATLDVVQEVPEVVEMPWWVYGPVGMQLWFPSIVLGAMQLQTMHSSSSNSTLHSQASLPAQLTPLSSSGPGPFIGGLGSRAGSGVPVVVNRSGSIWPPAGKAVQGSGGSSTAMAIAAAAAAAAAEGGQLASSGGSMAAMKHAQSAPSLAQEVPGGFQAIQYGTEIELEFDREVYPIGVSLADASIVGITQRVMRPQLAAPLQGQSPRGMRASSVASRHHPLSSQGSLPAAAAAAASSSNSLSLPCFLPVPESQPVLPALLRRLLQQGALPEALALAKRHEGGPHFKRSLEWLLFTTLDMEGSKCKPGKAGLAAADAGGWQQPRQQPLHVLHGGMGAAAGVLGRQGKGWLGHVDGQPHPVPVTPLLAAAVDLVLSFEQCLDVVVSVSRKTDASLWPALFSAVGSPSAVLEMLLDTGSLTSAACFLIVVDRLEGSRAAQQFAVQLIQLALKRGQFYLCAEILRFLIPPREGPVQWGPGSPMDGTAAAAGAEDASAGLAKPAVPQKQQSVPAEAAASSSGWFSWIWGGGSQQQQQAADKAGKQPGQGAAAAAVRDVIGAGFPKEALVSQSSLSATVGVEHGSEACKLVADKAWVLLYQGKLNQLVQLIHSMSFLTGGLASIMAAFEPPQGISDASLAAATSTEADAARLLGSKEQQQQQWVAAGEAGKLAAAADEGEVTVDVLIGCVLATVDELPVWESTDIEQDAVLALGLVKELQVQRWTLALAVVLVDMSVLGPFATAQPQLWQQFCEQLLDQPELYFLHQLVGALAQPGGLEEAMAAEAADEAAIEQRLQ